MSVLTKRRVVLEKVPGLYEALIGGGGRDRVDGAREAWGRTVRVAQGATPRCGKQLASRN